MIIITIIIIITEPQTELLAMSVVTGSCTVDMITLTNTIVMKAQVRLHFRMEHFANYSYRTLPSAFTGSYLRTFCTSIPATTPMVVGRLAAHTPSLFKVFSSIFAATTRGGAHFQEKAYKLHVKEGF